LFEYQLGQGVGYLCMARHWRSAAGGRIAVDVMTTTMPQ
jgi:hypothetical protein